MNEAGFSKQVIDAAWPTWWDEDSDSSASAKASLRFAISRRLGISPTDIVGERVNFFWDDDAKYKNLTTESAEEISILSSFGISAAKAILTGIKEASTISGITSLDLRKAILGSHQYVDLQGLLATCWSLGTPVGYLKIFPLEAKRMQAMCAGSNQQAAILLGKKAPYPAMIAFTLAHEIAHIALGHIGDGTAVVDFGDPAQTNEKDDQEVEADRYAMALLTGAEELIIKTNVDSFTASSLADAVLEVGPKRGIDPAILALCAGFQYNAWPSAIKALKYIYGDIRGPTLSSEINALAHTQLDWTLMSDDTVDWVRKLFATTDD